MAELRAEAQGVITSLERALAEEREQGKQRLHRRAPAPTQALTPNPYPSPFPSPNPNPYPNPSSDPDPNP